MKSVAAIIVARGGSKGVPRKNLRPLAGKPLIVHTFEAARASRHLERILLSTDDPELAELGRQHGVEVPFLRPAELATDRSPVIDATLHLFQWLEKQEQYFPTFGLLLQPTSPFRTGLDIDGAIELAESRRADAVVGVVPVGHHPLQMKRMDADGRLWNWMETDAATNRRQDLPVLYGINGAIYLVRREVLLEKKTWCPGGAFAYVMPESRSLDIDTEWDLHVAECVLTHPMNSSAG